VINGIPIANTYVPQGHSIQSEKYVFQLEWFKRIRESFETDLDPREPALWVGDWNATPEPIEVYHPGRRVSAIHSSSILSMGSDLDGSTRLHGFSFIVRSGETVPLGRSFLGGRFANRGLLGRESFLLCLPPLRCSGWLSCFGRLLRGRSSSIRLRDSLATFRTELPLRRSGFPAGVSECCRRADFV
jgi:hypothetical protein